MDWNSLILCRALLAPHLIQPGASKLSLRPTKELREEAGRSDAEPQHVVGDVHKFVFVLPKSSQLTVADCLWISLSLREQAINAVPDTYHWAPGTLRRRSRNTNAPLGTKTGVAEFL